MGERVSTPERDLLRLLGCVIAAVLLALVAGWIMAGGDL